MLMQEHPIKLVKRISRLVGYQSAGIGGIGCLRLSRASRSSVRIADALATDWRPDRGRDCANRRSSSKVAESKTGPVLIEVGWGRKFHRSLQADPPGGLQGRIVPQSHPPFPPLRVSSAVQQPEHVVAEPVGRPLPWRWYGDAQRLGLLAQLAHCGYGGLGFACRLDGVQVKVARGQLEPEPVRFAAQLAQTRAAFAVDRLAALPASARARSPVRSSSCSVRRPSASSFASSMYSNWRSTPSLLTAVQAWRASARWSPSRSMLPSKSGPKASPRRERWRGRPTRPGRGSSAFRANRAGSVRRFPATA